MSSKGELAIVSRKHLVRFWASVGTLARAPLAGALTPVRQIQPRLGSLNSGGIGSVILTPDGRGYIYGYGVDEATLFLLSGVK